VASSLSPIHRPARDLGELFDLHDTAFIQCAYWTVLGRPADPVGMDHFRMHLRRGVAKAQMLLELARSPEGQAAGCDLPGLDRLLRRHEKTRHRWFGALYALRYGIESPTPRARRQRATINAIWAVEQTLSARIDALEDRLASLTTRGPAAPVTVQGRAMTARGRELLGALSDAMGR
jgi:hypothetical protein